MSVKKYIFFLLALMVSSIAFSPCAMAQDKPDTSGDDIEDLAKMLNDNPKNAAAQGGYYVSSTFQSTRIINGQSVENTGKGVLDFRIAHRFGEVNEGLKNLYGLDNATTKFSFDYGITNWLTVGVGRSSYEKEYDGFLKIKLMRQTADDHHPVSISYVTGMSAQTMDVINVPGFTYYLSNRLYFFDQVIFARKFNKWLSVQLIPTYLHYNLVTEPDEPNDIFAMGIAGRMKVSKRIAITGEYYYTVPGHKLDGYNNSISVGVDIETGGHVFQLFFTNAANITERTFIAETSGDPLKGAMHLGFNISRVFTVVRPKEPKG